MENLEKLRTAFAEALGMDRAGITDALSFGDSPWDSIAHMAIVASIERAFDIMLDTDDVVGMSSFKVAKEIVGKYGITTDIAG